MRRSYLHIKFVFPLFTSSFCVSFISDERNKLACSQYMGPHNSSNSQGNAKMVIHKWRRKSDPEYTRTYFLGKTRTKPHEVYQPRSLGVAQALFTTLAGPMTGTFKSTFFLAFIIIIFYYTCIIYRSIAACA